MSAYLSVRPLCPVPGVSCPGVEILSAYLRNSPLPLRLYRNLHALNPPRAGCTRWIGCDHDAAWNNARGSTREYSTILAGPPLPGAGRSGLWFRLVLAVLTNLGREERCRAAFMQWM